MRTELRKSIVLFVLLCCICTSAGVAATYAAEADSVRIVSVTPDAVADYAHPMTFTVVVDYTLSSRNEALVSLNFNTTKADLYTLYDETVIQAGSGTLTLSTTITPIGWGTSYSPKGALGNLVDSFMGRSFKAYVRLTPCEEWDTLLSYDTFDLRHGVPAVEMELDSLLLSTRSVQYNPDLALNLMQLADAAYETETDTVEAFAQLGFPRDAVEREYTEKPRFEWDSAKYTVGQKFLSSGEQLVLIVIRGTDGDILSMSPDWISNFYMGDAYSEIAWHQGFKAAAYEVYQYVKDEVFDGNLPRKNVKYVLTGHSRGAAIANLVSVLLMEDGVSRDNVYDYNFACPDVARDMAGNWDPNGAYDNIFNIGNCSDPISRLPGVTGDALPFALDFFANKDKWYGKVIDALNQTSVEQLYTSWGKYGRNYWFSENWNYTPGLMPDFLSHGQDCYLSYLSKRLPLSEMKTWPEIQSTILSSGPSKLIHAVSGIFLCPVEAVFKDPEGNILAWVKDGELDYSAADGCCAVIFTDGDKKVIQVQSTKDIQVELRGTGNGAMSMVLMECDPVASEYSDAVFYENIALKDGKELRAIVQLEQPLDTVEVVSLNSKGEVLARIQEDGTEVRLSRSNLLDAVSGRLWIVFPLLAVLLIGGIVVVIKRSGSKRRETNDLFGPQSPTLTGTGDIVCSCGAANPPWVRECIMCGRKLKRR